MAKCIACGQNVNIWRSKNVYLFQTEQFICPECFDQYDKAYKTADEEGRFALMEKLARSPDLKRSLDVGVNMEKQREQLKAELARKRQEEAELAQRKSYTSKFASCCGQPMTELGVSTFQLGEATFFNRDLNHVLSGSKKMSIFRCDTCGQLKFFDPEFIK